MNRLNLDWFHALENREQWMLVLGGAVLLLYLIYIGLWRPLHVENKQLSERNAAAAETLQWMRNGAERLQQQQGRENTSTGQSISQLLNASVASGDIRFSRFQPRGEDLAQVWFEDTEFAKLFVWLESLSRQNVAVSNLSVTGSSRSGLVSASLQLQKQ